MLNYFRSMDRELIGARCRFIPAASIIPRIWQITRSASIIQNRNQSGFSETELLADRQAACDKRLCGKPDYGTATEIQKRNLKLEHFRMICPLQQRLGKIFQDNRFLCGKIFRRDFTVSREKEVSAN